MATTRFRIGKQNHKSVTPKSLVYTDGANEQLYFAPPSGGDFILKWDNAATDLSWLSTSSLINIYNNDGALTGSRTLTGGTNTLNFNFNDGTTYTSDYVANSVLQYLNVTDTAADTSASVEISPYSIILSTIDNLSSRQAQLSLGVDLTLYRSGATGANSITFSDTGMLVTDSNTSQGLKYAADYAAYFATNPRSIPDVGYVSTLIAAIPNLWTDAGAYTYLTSLTDNLGIGLNTAPAAKLHVKGSGATSSTYTAQFHNSTGASNSLLIKDDGAIALGTTTTTNGQLTVNRNIVSNQVSSNRFIMMGAVSGFENYPGLWMGQSTPDLTNYAFLSAVAEKQNIFNAPSTGAVLFRIADSTVMTMNVTGLGIGADPIAPLDMGSAPTNQKILLYNSGAARMGFGVAAGVMRIFTPDANKIVFGGIGLDGTTWTQRMQFDNTTYSLSINSVSTAARLFVAGTGSTSASYTAQFHNSTGTSNSFLIRDDGTVGVGITPSAYLTIKAGTTASGTAPIKFTAGNNLTTPEAGAHEWDGTRLYMTQTTGPTRQTLAYLSDLTTAGIGSGVTNQWAYWSAPGVLTTSNILKNNTNYLDMTSSAGIIVPSRTTYANAAGGLYAVTGGGYGSNQHLYYLPRVGSYGAVLLGGEFQSSVYANWTNSIPMNPDLYSIMYGLDGTRWTVVNTGSSAPGGTYVRTYTLNPLALVSPVHGGLTYPGGKMLFGFWYTRTPAAISVRLRNASGTYFGPYNVDVTKNINNGDPNFGAFALDIGSNFNYLDQIEVTITVQAGSSLNWSWFEYIPKDSGDLISPNKYLSMAGTRARITQPFEWHTGSFVGTKIQAGGSYFNVGGGNNDFLGVGTATLMSNTALTIVNPVADSGSYYSLRARNRGGSEVFNIRGDGAVGAGVVPSANIRLQVGGLGATSSTYTAQFHNSTGTNNALIIRDDGNVGLSTSAPTQKLDVNGGARFRGAFYDYTNSAGTSGDLLVSFGPAAGAVWQNLTTLNIPTGSGYPTQIAYYVSGSGLASESGSGANAFTWVEGTNRFGVRTSAPSSAIELRTDGLGVTQTTTDGFTISNTTAATSGNQQISPAIILTGRAWKTAATAASIPVGFRAYVTPVQSVNGFARLSWGSLLNTTWTDDQIVFTSDGNVGIGITSPSVKLHIDASTAATNYMAATGSNSTSSAVTSISLSRTAGSGSFDLVQSHTGTGNNCFVLQGNTTGDLFMLYNIGGPSVGYTHGIDSSDGYLWKLGGGGFGINPSTITQVFLSASHSSGKVGIRTNPHGIQDVYMLGTLRLDLGSDAAGDTYYRDATGAFTKLPIGSPGDVLTVSSGIPAWTAPSGGSGTVTGTGSAGQVSYWSTTTAQAGTNDLFWNTSTNRLGIGGTVTPVARLHIKTDGLGTTQTVNSGIYISNDTAAAAGAQQISPSLILVGSGWKTASTAASQSMAFRMFVTPIQGISAPTSFLGIGSSVNGFYTDNQFVFTNEGKFAIGTTTPDATSILDLTSTTLGVLLPRMTTTQKNAIISPANGLLLYDSTLNKLNVYESSAWKNLGDGIYNGSGSLSSSTTVSQGNYYLGFAGTSGAGHATTMSITPASGQFYVSAADTSGSGPILGELIVGEGFASMSVGDDLIPTTTLTGISFASSGSNWNWGPLSIAIDGSGIHVDTAGFDGLIYAADYSASILANNNSIPDIFTVRENAIENYNTVTSTTSPFNLNGLAPDYLIAQGGTQATFTFSLPATPDNGEICKLTFSTAVTALTITAQGGVTILGTTATTAAIGTQLVYKYYSTISAWIRIQ